MIQLSCKQEVLEGHHVLLDYLVMLADKRHLCWWKAVIEVATHIPFPRHAHLWLEKHDAGLVVRKGTRCYTVPFRGIPAPDTELGARSQGRLRGAATDPRQRFNLQPHLWPDQAAARGRITAPLLAVTHFSTHLLLTQVQFSIAVTVTQLPGLTETTTAVLSSHQHTSSCPQLPAEQREGTHLQEDLLQPFYAALVPRRKYINSAGLTAH